MMLQYTAYSTAVATAAVMAFCAQSSAQPMFTGMGKPTPSTAGGAVQVATIRCIADSGEVFGQGDGPACVWSLAAGYEYVSFPNSGSFARIDSCTTDGQVFVGIGWDGATGDIPAIWYSKHTPPVLLPGFPAGWTCFDVYCNATGSIVVGNMRHQTTNQPGIFIWRDGPATSKKKMQIITEFPVPFAAAGVLDLNDRGDRGVGGGYSAGITEFLGLLWQHPNTLTVVYDLPGGLAQCGFSSTDWAGRVAVGQATPSDLQAARWTEFHGLVSIGKLSASHNGASAAGNEGSNCDASGFVAVGVSELGPPSAGRTAVLWNPIDGMRSVEDVLVNDYGLTEVTPWQLTDVDAISPNGRYIAGRGINPQGENETWFAQITPFCYADCNGDKVLNIFDYICFGSEFANQTLYANCDNDGRMNIFDYICFGNHFAEGCP